MAMQKEYRPSSPVGVFPGSMRGSLELHRSAHAKALLHSAHDTVVDTAHFGRCR